MATPEWAAALGSLGRWCIIAGGWWCEQLCTMATALQPNRDAFVTATRQNSENFGGGV